MRISNRPVMAVALLAFASLAACYKPEYASNPDAHMGFRCHKTDNPACPPNLVCCTDSRCGDDLSDTEEGWCVTPRPPADMTVSAKDFWMFPSKGMYFDGVYTPAPLSGYDEQMQWRCTRDDTNPDPANAIKAVGEPNDLPEQAIVLPSPLPMDLTPGVLGYPHQICPDKTAPDVPDIDVFKFKLTSPAKVIAEIKYTAALGDLDIFVFQLVVDSETGKLKPQLARPTAKDTTAVDNGCIELPMLPAGAYYVVVRGTPIPEQPGKYTMNDYRLRVFTVEQSPGYSCNLKKDMGP